MAKARSLNKVLLIGNLTRDPILRKSSGDVLVCTFGIATNTSWKDVSGDSQERAEFHNIVAFNKLAEICAQVLSTGMLVYLEGEIRSRAKETRDGHKYFKTEIKLNDMILLNSNDRVPVGIENALRAGEDLVSKLGTNSAPEPYTKEEDTPRTAAPVAKPAPAPAPEAAPAEEEDFNSGDLF